jgi:hypothetical protein
MKFAKYLEANAIAKWKGHYVNYKGLKKLLKALPAAPVTGSGDGAADAGAVAAQREAVAAVSRRFIEELQKEVARVNAFVLMRQDELLEERHAIEDARSALPSAAAAGSSAGAAAAAAAGIEVRKQLMHREREVRGSGTQRTWNLSHERPAPRTGQAPTIG